MTARILWLTKGLGRGGAERLITTCTPHLDAGKYTIEVAYLLPEKTAYVDRLRDRGVTVHCLDAPRDLNLGWTRRLRSLIQHGDFSIVHTQSPLPAAVARVTTSSRATRMVHTEHNMWSRYHRGTYWANALTYPRNNAVIAVSQAVADTIPSHHLARQVRHDGVDVVLHGVDLDEGPVAPDARASARESLGLPQDALVVGTVGNLTEKKDHRMLLQAFAALHQRVPQARLCIIGSGPLEHRVAGWVDQLGIRAVTTLPGSRDDARELLPAFDVFALSSRFEGLSIALVEALAAGLPCVSTRVGGVPEVLEGSDAGVMVPAGDAAGLTRALQTVLADEQLRGRMGEAALARAAAFDVRRSVRQIEAIYERVLAA